MLKFNLKQFFLPRADCPNQMETLRVPLDERQSPNFISYRAVRRWYGLYDIETCIYTPSSIFEQRRKELEKNIFISEALLVHPIWKGTSYVGVITEIRKKSLTYNDAVHFLNEFQNRLIVSEVDIVVRNKPEKYFREFDYK